MKKLTKIELGAVLIAIQYELDDIQDIEGNEKPYTERIRALKRARKKLLGIK